MKNKFITAIDWIWYVMMMFALFIVFLVPVYKGALTACISVLQGEFLIALVTAAGTIAYASCMALFMIIGDKYVDILAARCPWVRKLKEKEESKVCKSLDKLMEALDEAKKRAKERGDALDKDASDKAEAKKATAKKKTTKKKE